MELSRLEKEKSMTARQWLREKSQGLNYWATCPTATLKPEKVDIELCGKHVSAVLDRGVRTYAFASMQYRDRFVNKYRANGARQCGSPFS